jgi:hypothetical protein
VVFEYAITCCGRVMIDFMKTESLGVMFLRATPISGSFRIDHRGRTEVERITYFSRMRDHRRLEIFQIVYNHINISHNRLRGDVKKPAVNSGSWKG